MQRLQSKARCRGHLDSPVGITHQVGGFLQPQATQGQNIVGADMQLPVLKKVKQAAGVHLIDHSRSCHRAEIQQQRRMQDTATKKGARPKCTPSRMSQQSCMPSICNNVCPADARPPHHVAMQYLGLVLMELVHPLLSHKQLISVRAVQIADGLV